ncbi:MAG: class I SAM-dependent methyltransferase [Candidatus Peribacteraceae bacterium]|jgi:SAM-dependent methyltransferase|nr:class I SAM-dependent methyltransferase [Candidatus Peribacteraceae bacterium]
MGILDAIGLTRKITRPRLRVFLKKYASTGRVLDVGCGAASYRDLFPQLTTLDIEPREGMKVDIVTDAHDLRQIPDASFDVVLCTEVLEHLHTPPQAIAEFRRVLKQGGLLLLSTRFIFPLHDVPGDYYRFTKYGLKHLLEEFQILELSEEASTVETLAVLEQRIGFQCETLWFRPFKIFWFLLAGVTRWCGWLLTREYGDIRHQVSEKNILTSGYYVAARKS